MHNEFLNYKQSLGLKSMNFNEPCLRWYLMGALFNNKKRSQPISPYACSAPLKQQAFRFFRNKYGISCEIACDFKTRHKYTPILNHPIGKSYLINYETYEEAEDACINEIIKVYKVERK